MTTRIYYSEPIEHHDILLKNNDAHHLMTVLRQKVGDTVILFDGCNTEYHAVIARAEKKQLWLTVLDTQKINRESPLHIHLIQGVSKGDRMDWVVQKAVELGVSRITPVYTQHSAVKRDHTKMDKKIDHWQKIAISACEQCGRNVIPQIDAIGDLVDIYSICSNTNTQTIRWILHPKVDSIYSLPMKPITHATLLIGPEGGFSALEVSQAHAAGYTPVTVGSRILRTETAAIAAIATLQTAFGDWF